MNDADNLPELTPEEERLLELLADYDEALATGALTPGTTPTPPDLDAGLAEDLQQGQRLLDLLATMRAPAAQRATQPRFPGTASRRYCARWIKMARQNRNNSAVSLCCVNWDVVDTESCFWRTIRCSSDTWP